jgi:hypothetical protein
MWDRENWRLRANLTYYDIMSSLWLTSLFHSPGDRKFWRFESFLSLFFVCGTVVFITEGLLLVGSLDPTEALMTSTVARESVCVNLTCGGLYCSFTQHPACREPPVFMIQSEVYEFCMSSMAGCTWTAEVLSTSDYDNRSKSLYIMQDGSMTSFPQLESLLVQSVDVEKYVDARAGQQIISWNVQPRTESTLMKTCGNNVKSDQRCGRYQMFVSPLVYEQKAHLHYVVVCSLLLIGILIAVVSLKYCLNSLLNFHRGVVSFSEKVSSKKFT